jgi:hypothetical protein
MYNIIQLKIRNSVICNNMGGSGKQYTKLNKTNTERQILCALVFVWNLKQMNSQRQRAAWHLSETWDVNKGKMVFER